MLSKEDAHHVRDVLRAAQGSAALLIHPATRAAFTVALEISPKAVTALITSCSKLPDVRSYAHTVCPALLKGAHNDLIVEKCTELGAERIYFWEAARSVIRLKGPRREERERRFRALGEAAARQSKRSSTPEIIIFDSLSGLLNQPQISPLRLYAGSLGANARELKNGPVEHTACFITGPEGDFSPEEWALLAKLNAVEISLGPFTLRAETSAVAMVAGVNAAWGWDNRGFDESSARGIAEDGS